MNLPSDFAEYSRSLMGEALYARLSAALDSADMPTSIRLNPYKSQGLDVAPDLLDAPVPWCEATGRYLSARPNFTFDPLLHAGVYYVQEAASMFVDYVVRMLIKSKVRMLDLCAAPGGKSTALRAALPEGSLLFSNEPMRTRAQILCENMQKFGHEDVVVTNSYPRDYRKSRLLFDAILADVPCSGEGMFRKDDGARQEWSLQNVDNCWHLQRDIIADVWDCLRPGGLLVYSTCTFNAHEDEDNVEWIARELGADFVELPLPAGWHITPALTGSAPVCRFMPGFSRSEGLFLAVLRKHGDAPSVMDNAAAADKSKKRNRRGTASAKPKKGNNLSMAGLADMGRFDVRSGEGIVRAIPAAWADAYDAACASPLKVIHAGIELATEKGRDLIPSQSLALARCLDSTAYTCVELDYDRAIAYLRKEAIAMPEGTPRGFVLLCYRGHAIGFAKNIGNRANNLYPQEWRIKSSHVPDNTEILTKTE